MSRLMSLVLVAGLASAALGFQPGTPAQPPRPTSGAPAPTGAPGQSGQPAAPAPMAAPAEPTGIPVPNMPVIDTKEIDGITIEDMKIGTGPAVPPHAVVVAFYHGTLKSDGTKFDSAFERGEAIPFGLDNVIQGWGKGVPGMKIGGIRRLTIPAALAYGEQGRPPVIPPNSDLVFVIQLEDFVYSEDISAGTGEEATMPFVAVAAQTIKDESGKVVSTSDSENPYIWLPGEMQSQQQYGSIEAFQTAMEGMKVGGKRRLHIPKQFNLANPVITGRPTEITCDMEVELVAVRNLRPRPQPGAAPTPGSR